MSHLFISYKHSNGDFAEILMNRVKDAGFEVWIDEDDDKLPPGSKWREEIDKAIKDAFAVIVIITPQARASEYVIYELGFAYGAGVKVIPIMLESTELHPRLVDLQYLDFTNRRTRQWDTLLKTLMKAVTTHGEEISQLTAGLPTSIKQAIDALESSLPDLRSEAIKSLARTSHPAAKEALLEALNSSMLDVRIEAALALPDARAVPILIDALHGMNKDISNRAVKALTRIGTPSIGYLLRALQDENVRLRRNAAIALGDIRDEVTVPGLLEALSDSDENVRSNTALALGQIGIPSVGGLLKALKDGNRKVRADVAWALGLTGGVAAVQDLLEALRHDKEKDVRVQAAVALGQIGHTNALAGLLDALLSDEEGDVRFRAARSLGRIEHPDAVPGLL